MQAWLLSLQVITGAAEGAYGWAALNYGQGRLHGLPAQAPLVGALDLGGSSLEVGDTVLVCWLQGSCCQ
jgi:hypothetical protein